MTLVGSTEKWDTVLALASRRKRSRRSAAAAQRLLAAAQPERADRTGAASWSWPPTSSSSPRKAESRKRPGPRGRRRGPHGHRRLSLVHRLGPRHHDQPRRPDPDHRPASRGRLYPAHLRPLCPRRADPQLVPRGQKREASTTPPTPRSGSSTPSTAMSWLHERSQPRCTLLLPKLVGHHRASPARHALRHRRRSGAMGCCGRARKAISSPGWTPRSATGS